MPEDRVLAAILCSDIVGYTALMNRDEENALQILHKNRDIQKSMIEKYRGKWLMEMGDGILASFSTVTEAVYCAQEIQKVCSNEPELNLRIGIHLGEVIIKDDEVFGDGVNIASRLQSIAPKCGIYVTELVHDNIVNKKGINSRFIKEEKLKNVKEPVKIYEIDVDKDDYQKQDHTTSKKSINYPYIIVGILILIVAAFFVWQNLIKKPDINLDRSIAVRPFWNESASIENAYFVNGITEDIRNNLAKISDVRVISRGSMEKFRDAELTTKEIAKELDVIYILEGTVQRLEDHVKIHVQLILAEDDDHLWETSYEHDLSDINEVYKIQSQIAQSVAEELEAIITPQEKQNIETIPTKNQEAYDFYLRGRDAFFRFYLNRNKPDLDYCVQLLNQAINSDQEFALPYAWLGRAIEYQIGQKIFIDYKDDTILSLCNKALSLEPNLGDGYWIRGRYFRNIGQFQKAINDLTQAITINPNDALAYRYLGTTHFFNRSYIEAIKNLKRAERLVRGNELTQLYSDIGKLYISIGEEQKAEKYYIESLRLQPNFIEGYRNLIWADIRQGNFERAFKNAEKLYSLYPEHTSSYSLMVESLTNLKKYNEAEEYYKIWKTISNDTGEDALFSRHRFAYLLWMNGKKEQASEEFLKHMEVCESSIRSGGLYGQTLAAYDLAGINAFLGDKNLAYKWLREYARDGFIYGLHKYITVDPLFESLWVEQEFKNIVRQQETKFGKIRTEIDQLELKGEL